LPAWAAGLFSFLGVRDEIAVEGSVSRRAAVLLSKVVSRGFLLFEKIRFGEGGARGGG
jgi:hypothetical protein